MLQRYIIDPETGEKRLNLELFLPLGGMIIVGIAGLILGAFWFKPDKVEDDGPIELPSLESYEQNRLRKLQSDAGLAPDATPDAPVAPVGAPTGAPAGAPAGAPSGADR